MTNISEFAANYLFGIKCLLDVFDTRSFQQIVEKILEAYDAERHIFVMGNGGSGATASHFTCDINKGCCMNLSKKFKMICLNDSLPTLLALANDVSYDAVFVEQLKNFFLPGDLVIGISGSGNSPNVLRAIEYAKTHQGTTVGLSGFSGGNLASLADIAWVAPVEDMQKTEDMHMIVVHMIMQAVRNRLDPIDV
jgi:D-sedoheptulose 7-phosphate isomerase